MRAPIATLALLATLVLACSGRPSSSPPPPPPIATPATLTGPTVALGATTFADPDVIYRVAGTPLTYHLHDAIVRIATDGTESSRAQLDVTDGADHTTLTLPPDSTWHGHTFSLGTANFGHADITVR